MICPLFPKPFLLTFSLTLPRQDDPESVGFRVEPVEESPLP